MLGRPESHREHGLVFGAAYDSAVIVPDGTPPIPVVNPVTDYVPDARPGCRAPHVWIERAGERISTLDLLGHAFVLLTGIDGQNWCDASQQTSRRLGVPLEAFRIGRDGDLNESGKTWTETYGIYENGAVLVRPDGHVAWRCATSQADLALEIEIALTTALGGRSTFSGWCAR